MNVLAFSEVGLNSMSLPAPPVASVSVGAENTPFKASVEAAPEKPGSALR